MENRDDFYALQETLNNLLLLRHAYSAGLDMRIFTGYQSEMYGYGYCNWELFLTAVAHLFEGIDHFIPGDDERREEMEYWLSLIDPDKDYEEYKGLMVILDDRVKPFSYFMSGTFARSDWYQGYAEIHPIENGILIDYDEEMGAIDWTDVFATLPSLLKLEENNKGAMLDEMAV